MPKQIYMSFINAMKDISDSTTPYVHIILFCIASENTF